MASDETKSLVLKTTDGGTTWSTYLFPTFPFFVSIYFVDSLQGWVVGDAGVVFKTINGGDTWTRQGDVPGTSINASVHFADTQTGWIVGLDDAIAKTTNGGASWTPQPHPTPSGAVGQLSIFGVGFADAQTGWAVAEGKIIFKTTNGGSSWTLQPVSPGIPGTAFWNVKCLNVQKAWVVGDFGSILYTDNGGITAVASMLSESKVSIFPNPSSSVIQLRSAVPIRQVQISDAAGRMIRIVEHPLNTLTINDLPKGLYYLHIETSEGVSVQKIVRE